MCRFSPDDTSEVQSNTDDNIDLNGKYMHFLKDRECNNGKNHNVSSQGDCRAKASIRISEAGPVQVGRCGLPFKPFHQGHSYGHPPTPPSPHTLQDQFCNSSKTEDKLEGGGGGGA